MGCDGLGKVVVPEGRVLARVDPERRRPDELLYLALRDIEKSGGLALGLQSRAVPVSLGGERCDLKVLSFRCCLL